MVIAAGTRRLVGDLFEYEIEHPVTIKRNQSALVPIVLRPFDGKPALLHNSRTRRSNPMRAVEFHNTTGLTPPDMGVGADATHVVQMVNVVGKIWTSGVAGSWVGSSDASDMTEDCTACYRPSWSGGTIAPEVARAECQWHPRSVPDTS